MGTLNVSLPTNVYDIIAERNVRKVYILPTKSRPTEWREKEREKERERERERESDTLDIGRDLHRIQWSYIFVSETKQITRDLQLNHEPKCWKM